MSAPSTSCSVCSTTKRSWARCSAGSGCAGIGRRSLSWPRWRRSAGSRNELRTAYAEAVPRRKRTAVRFDAGTEFDRQISTLLTAGYPAVSAMSAAALRDLLEPLREPVLAVAEGGPEPGRMPFLLVPVLPPALTMPLTALAGRPGQVSRLLPDLDRFTPLPDLQVPAAGAYALLGVERGEEFCGRVPTEALAEIAGRGRTPLTVAEGVALVTQFPAALAK